MRRPGRREFARPFLIVSAIVGFALNSARLEAKPIAQCCQLLATTEVASGGGIEIDLVKWAFTQGALALVLIVVLWSYRRDYARIIARDERDASVQIATLTALVGDCKGAIEAARAQSAETGKAIDRLARAIERRLTHDHDHGEGGE